MNLNKKNLLLTILAGILISCSTNKKEFIVLKPTTQLTMLSDSSFFGDIWAMGASKEYIYATDNSPQILQLDYDLTLSGRIDDVGKGPGEFTSVASLCIVDDSLFVYNRSEAKILVYDSNNNFIREIGLNNPYSMDFAVDKKSRIYLSTPYRDNPITVLNATGQKINTFGNNSANKKSVNARRNERYLFIRDNKLIAVSRSDPFIKVFSLAGGLLSQTEIDHPLLQNRIDYIKETYETNQYSGSLSILFYDATALQNSIYFLAHTHVRGNPEPNYTFVIAYTLQKNGKLTYENAYKLFRPNPKNRLYGFRLTAFGKRKLMIYDLKGKSLLTYEIAE